VKTAGPYILPTEKHVGVTELPPGSEACRSPPTMREYFDLELIV
jgi:hypothetical protein